jgi:hypothetical protein
MNQIAKISLVARPVLWRTFTLEDLERVLSRDVLLHRGLTPTAAGRQQLRKCKISIISGFPQATGALVMTTG